MRVTRHRLRPALLLGALLLAHQPYAAPAPEAPKTATGTAAAALRSYDAAANHASADFLDQLLTQGLPAGYGELLAQMVQAGEDELRGQVVSGGSGIAQAAGQKLARDSLKRILDAVSDLSTLLDVGGKVYAEQYDEAALSGTLAVLGKLAAANDAAAMKAIGLSGTAVFTAAVVAVQVWWASEKELRAQTRSAEMESLYGRVESMLSLGKRGHDPFPATAANVDLVWQRILTDPTFRRLFSVYVGEMLGKGQELPEAAWYDRLAAHSAAQVLRLTSEPMTGDELVEFRTQTLLREQEMQVKGHVAGLVSWLNRQANHARAAVEARKALAAVQSALQQAGTTHEQVAQRIQRAVAMLGVVEVYARDVPARIDEALKEKDYKALEAQRITITNYVRDVIAWVPQVGPEGELRNRLLVVLRSAHARTEREMAAMLGEIRKRVDQPRVEAASGPSAAEAAPPDSGENLYASMYRPMIRPFDWGGVGELLPLRKKYIELLEDGQFVSTRDHHESNLPQGRRPLAEAVAKAFANEDYPGALNLSFTPPQPLQTLNGYYQDLLYRINAKPEPATLQALVSSLNQGLAQVEALRASRRAARGDERTRLDAQIAARSAELAPLQAAVTAQRAAWFAARALAASAAEAQRSLDEAERSTMMAWLAQVRGPYDERAQAAGRAVAAFQAALSGQGHWLPLEAAAWSEQLARWKAGVLSHQASLPQVALVDLGVISDAGSNNLHPDEVRARLTAAADRLRYAEGQFRVQSDGAVGGLRAICANAQGSAQALDGAQAVVEPDLPEIRRFIDPAFLSEVSLTGRAQAARQWAEEPCRLAEQAAERARDHVDDLQRAATKLRGMSAAWADWAAAAVDLGLLAQAQSWPAPLSARLALEAVQMQGQTRYVLPAPYYRLLSTGERARFVSALRARWVSSGLQPFARQHLPWLFEPVETFLQHLAQLPVHPAENMLSAGFLPVTAAALQEGERLLGGLQPGTASYPEQRQRISAIVGWIDPRNGDYSQAPLYPRYAALAKRLEVLDAQQKAAIDPVQQAASERARERQHAGQISNDQIQTLYQAFINAYGRGDVRGLLALMAPDWSGGDGADARDVEDYLTNSFKVFDRIQYRIGSFSASPIGDGSVQISYTVKIVGENRRQRLTHTEERRIVENVGLIQGQARILRTVTGNQWLR